MSTWRSGFYSLQLCGSPGLNSYWSLILRIKHIGGKSLCCWTQGLRCLIWGIVPSLLQSKYLMFEIPLGWTYLGWSSRWVSLSPPCLHVALSSFVCRRCLSSTQVLFTGKLFHAAVNLLCPWEEVSSGSSSTATVNSSLLGKFLLDSRHCELCFFGCFLY